MRALVTGATGNVGKATIELLHIQGWAVVGLSRGGSQISDYHAVDLSNQDEVIKFTKSLRGFFDLVIMTHGTQKAVELGSYTDDYDNIRVNNLDSAVYLTDALIHFDKLNPGALIIYCSSIHATQPRAGRGPYAIAKAGLEALARVVAIEQAPNIRAVALRLGQLTQVMRGVVFTEAQFKAIEERTPYPWVEPMDVAKLCLALYEQKSLSGAVIDVNSAHNLNVWP